MPLFLWGLSLSVFLLRATGIVPPLSTEKGACPLFSTLYF